MITNGVKYPDKTLGNLQLGPHDQPSKIENLKISVSNILETKRKIDENTTLALKQPSVMVTNGVQYPDKTLDNLQLGPHDQPSQIENLEKCRIDTSKMDSTENFEKLLESRKEP